MSELNYNMSLQLKIEEFKIEKEHFHLLKTNYFNLYKNDPTNISYEILFKQAQDDYDLVTEKISLYNSLLMNI